MDNTFKQEICNDLCLCGENSKIFTQRMDFLLEQFNEYKRLVNSAVEDERYFYPIGRTKGEIRRLTKSIRKNIIEIAQDYFNY